MPGRKDSAVREVDDYLEVELTKGLWSKIDRNDRWVVDDFVWFADANGYAETHPYWDRKSALHLHNLILNNLDGETLVDHINRDRLDNRRHNLRPASYLQNTYNISLGRNNTSGHMGVYLLKKTGRWGARIRVPGKRTFLGYFGTREEAGAAYQEAKAARDNWSTCGD